ncbi:MAG: hypothetical protein Q7K39_03900 [Candidatus Magasanikbacteria bacterium]|nr:hypothetical protein [Candidatus Magasanikbacteria bacterium]
MKKTNSKTWTKHIADSWNMWTPPDRPSPGELAVYEKALQGILARKKNARLLVLGSTSEFRDLAAKYKVPCTVLEYRAENYDILGSLMKRKKYRETLVVGDWRTAKLKQKVDLIVGDFCFGVVPKADQTKFIKNVSTFLAPGGVCMIKTFVRYDANRGDLAASLVWYRKHKRNRPILESIMAPMFKYAYNFSTEVTTFPDVWKNFVKLYQKKQMTAAELKYFEKFAMDKIPLKLYIPFFPDLIKNVRENATLVGVCYASDWFSIDVPIVIFKRP